MNATTGKSRFHALAVAEVRRETPDAVSVALTVPPVSAAPPEGALRA